MVREVLDQDSSRETQMRRTSEPLFTLHRANQMSFHEAIGNPVDRLSLQPIAIERLLAEASFPDRTMRRRSQRDKSTS